MCNLQKYFLVFLFIYMQSFVAMEDDKAIIPPIFTPMDNTSQANADLLEAIKIILKDPSQEQGWNDIEKCLKNGADPNLKVNYLQPLISLVLQQGKKDLFYYLLQRGADINAQDLHELTPLHTFISDRPTNFNIGDLLENRANTNATTVSGYTPLFLANEKGHLDFIKPLIQYKANINEKTNGITPLGWSLWKSKLGPEINLEAAKILCKAGASPINLDKYNHTVFHFARDEKEEFIKTLMTHIKLKNDDIKNTIKTILLVFNRLSYPLESETLQKDFVKFPVIPHEIQILILSKLLSPYFFHAKLYEQFKGEYQHFSLRLVNNHVQYVRQILRIENSFNHTALDLKSRNSEDSEAFVCGYRNEDDSLLEGTTLQEDFYILHKVYPNLSSIPKNNLALQILKNHYTFEPQ